LSDILIKDVTYPYYLFYVASVKKVVTTLYNLVPTK